MNKKVDILKASQILFSQFGLKKVTTDDISRISSISKATIYKHYKNKTEIYHDVIQLEFEQLMGSIKSSVDKEKTVKGKFRAHLITKMTKISDLINFYRITQEIWAEYFPYVEEVRQRFIKEEKEIVKNIIKLGNKNGELSVKDVDLTAHIMVISLKSMEFPWALNELGISLAEYINRMVDMLVNGLKKQN